MNDLLSLCQVRGFMFYPLPKKIQLEASQTKWSLDSCQSVFVLFGIDELRAMQGWEDSILFEHINQITKKAKALEIPVIDLTSNQDMKGMMRLGEQLSKRKQLIVAGYISAKAKQFLNYLTSVTEHMCIINDAIYVNSIDQHIQWITSLTQQKLHHVSCYSLIRLWSLSAPKELILSAKGILLAIAEQLDLEPLEIDPTIDLRLLGLDSVAIVSLIGLWRANGIHMRYEDFDEKNTLASLMNYLLMTEFITN